MTKIEILGEELDISYNLMVELAFADSAGQDFNGELLQRQLYRAHLLFASIKANNPKTSITFERMAKEASLEELSALDNALSKEMMAWRRIPSSMTVIEDAKPANDEEEDEEKKA